LNKSRTQASPLPEGLAGTASHYPPPKTLSSPSLSLSLSLVGD
jgi:hypothetical protein